MSMFSDVSDFHRAFSLPIADKPALPDAAQRSLRRKLLAEEHQEYHDAEDADDLVEVADALADMLYILYGTRVVYGLGDVDVLDRVARLEETQRLASSGSPVFPRGGVRLNRRNAIREAFDAYTRAEDADDLFAVSEALQALANACEQCAAYYQIPIAAVFDEVHRSNMAKMVDGVVLRRADGKVVKPPNWEPPNLRKVLYRSG